MTEFRPGRFEILPSVVKNLLIINVLVFLAQNVLTGPSLNFSFEDNFALHAWQSRLFRPWQLVTHMFLHGGWGHIFGNMLALWMFGSVLENLWGSKRFLTFYLICGLGAALMHLLFLSYEAIPMMRDYALLVQQQSGGNSESFVNAMASFSVKYHIRFDENLIGLIERNPSGGDAASRMFEALSAGYQDNLNTATLGASGAVFGVLAAFVYLFPNTYIYLYFLVPVKAKWLGLIYFSYELFFALRNSAGDNVARWAHIGGAIVGLLIVITWNKTNKKTFY